MSLAIAVPTVAQRHSILAGNYLENYLKYAENIYETGLLLFQRAIVPMRLGDTGADRGMPNGALKF